MPLHRIIVRHQRHQYQATDVLLEVPFGLTNDEYQQLARDYLYKTNYKEYCFVTENPKPDPKDQSRYDYE